MGKFERINYPDGQIGAKYISESPESIFGKEPRISPFIIKERINSYTDLFYIRAIADIIQHTGYSASMYKLFIPCLFGQRSDRRFTNSQSFDLKLICEVINACKFASVEILDPHSDVALALINNSVKMSSFEYVKQAVNSICRRNEAEHNYSEMPLLVSPDAGAYKKVYEFGEKLGCEVMGAMKCRVDGTPAVVFTQDVTNKECLIVDDLCDGGATFISLASLLKLHKARNIYLYVTHGLFSKGFESLQRDINHIYCTNSVKDLDDSQNIYGYLGQPWQKVSDYVTQFKVI